jgi:hypothetical protein
MFVAAPLRFLNVFLGDDGPGRPVKTRAVDQPRLKSLQLLAGNDVIVNVDNHRNFLLAQVTSYLAEKPTRQQVELE